MKASQNSDTPIRDLKDIIEPSGVLIIDELQEIMSDNFHTVFGVLGLMKQPQQKVGDASAE